jgi:aspartate/glutamate racemase
MLHLLDEFVFERIRNRGGLASEDVERLSSHVGTARDAGARAVLVTCSTLSPYVDDLPLELRRRVFKVDDMLMRVAVQRGGRTVIAATNFATLEPSRRTLMQAGAKDSPETVLIPDAFAAFQAGDFAKHDELLLQGILSLQNRADTIVLAQASMARILDRLPPHLRLQVLSSPELAIDGLLEAAAN